MNQNPPATLPAKSRRSTFWLFLGAGCGAVLLVCAGAGGIGAYRFYRSKYRIARSPAEVEQESSRIADFDPPSGFQPDVAITRKIPLGGPDVMTAVAFSSPGQDGGVYLGTGKASATAPSHPDQLRPLMEQELKRLGRSTRRLDMLETRALDVQIRGKSATFAIQKTLDFHTRRKYIQVEGIFEGKRGPALLLGQLPADTYSADDAETLVRSIR